MVNLEIKAAEIVSRIHMLVIKMIEGDSDDIIIEELADDVIDVFNNIGCPNVVLTSELNETLEALNENRG